MEDFSLSVDKGVALVEISKTKCREESLIISSRIVIIRREDCEKRVCIEE